MIVYQNKGYETRSDKPNEDWTGKALYIIPDGSNLAKKIIKLYPYYNFVLNEDNELIDVQEIEHETPTPEPSLEDRISAVEDVMLAMLEL